MRRLTVEIGMLRRRAASEKLFASTTFANTTSEVRSAIAFPDFQNMESSVCALILRVSFCDGPPGRTRTARESPTGGAGGTPRAALDLSRNGNLIPALPPNRAMPGDIPFETYRRRRNGGLAVMDSDRRVVSTTSALVDALASATVRHILIDADLSDVPTLSLSPGQRIASVETPVTVRF